MVRRSMLKQIWIELRLIRSRLDQLEPKPGDEATQQNVVSVSESALLALPDHLRQTFLAACKLEQISASLMADVTCRSRACESSNLNQLVRLGYLHKSRVGKTTCFMVNKEKGLVSRV